MMGSQTSEQVPLLRGHWVVRNVSWLKSMIRVVLGVSWVIDGYLKFLPGLASSLPDFIRARSYGQPAWLQPWFSFWASATSVNPGLFTYGIGAAELALGIALILGLMRKVAYLGGFLLSLMIWAVPEGFGGPYVPGSTDIGTGIIYVFVFLSLIMINALSGPSKYSVDYYLERRYPSWKQLAEFS